MTVEIIDDGRPPLGTDTLLYWNSKILLKIHILYFHKYYTVCHLPVRYYYQIL